MGFIVQSGGGAEVPASLVSRAFDLGAELAGFIFEQIEGEQSGDAVHYFAASFFLEFSEYWHNFAACCYPSHSVDSDGLAVIDGVGLKSCGFDFWRGFFHVFNSEAPAWVCVIFKDAAQGIGAPTN